MVRLKVNTTFVDTRFMYISIPHGTIKSRLLHVRVDRGVEFQFHMVRLKDILS